MAELMFGLGQTKKKKETEAKVRNTKAHLKDVTITETVESNVRADQHGREKDEKALRTETKTNLRDVTITKTIETDVRKEQHSRDKEWKETGKQQKKSNTNFDMARECINRRSTIPFYGEDFQIKNPNTHMAFLFRFLLFSILGALFN